MTVLRLVTVEVPSLTASMKTYVPVVVNVTVFTSAQGDENLTGAGPFAKVHITVRGSCSGAVAWPKRVRSFAGKARTASGPASTCRVAVIKTVTGALSTIPSLTMSWATYMPGR